MFPKLKPRGALALHVVATAIGVSFFLWKTWPMVGESYDRTPLVISAFLMVGVSLFASWRNYRRNTGRGSKLDRWVTFMFPRNPN